MIEQISFESTALRDNSLGDPHVRDVTVFLPPQYRADERYPVLYLLASHGNTAASFLNWKPWGESLVSRLDKLFTTISPALIVMPDSWTRLGSSQYLDSVIGNYETYLLDEIVPLIDERYPTSGQRGILGHSSGGYGAMIQAMKHPDVFHAVACHAGDMYFEFTCLPNITGLHQALEQYGGAAKFLEDIPTLNHKSGTFWRTVMTLCWSMAHGTNPDAPHGFDLPIDETTGALNQDVWERWLTFDPLRMLDDSTMQAALRQSKLVFFDAGSYDEYQLQVGARLLSKKMTELNIEHIFEEFPGGHSGSEVRYERSISLLVDALS